MCGNTLCAPHHSTSLQRCPERAINNEHCCNKEERVRDCIFYQAIVITVIYKCIFIFTACFNVSSFITAHFNKMIRGMIVQDRLPFSVVEQPYFMWIIATGFPRRHIESRPTLIQRFQAETATEGKPPCQIYT